jgi:hypothetical protein
MNAKGLKNIKISPGAHAKVSQLSHEMLGASRERIMEIAVDRLYDLVQKEGVGVLFKRPDNGADPPPQHAPPARGFSSPNPAASRMAGVGDGASKLHGSKS